MLLNGGVAAGKWSWPDERALLLTDVVEAVAVILVVAAITCGLPMSSGRDRCRLVAAALV